MATITGTAGNDSLVGTTGNDTISGLGGNDTLNGNGGTDFFDGGTGFDSIDLRANAAPLVINFGTGTISGGVSGTFTGIERVQAGTGNDSLLGAAGGQNLAGQGGNDTLHGAAGIDTLWGGNGADHFVFRETSATNADALGDFASGADKIVLDASVMTALGAGGNFAAGDARFWSSSTGAAHDADDRVLYNTTTRQVFYDADGNGSGAAVLIATLQSGATLVATDILVEGGSAGSTINGTEGDDTLIGTEGDDSIEGRGGNDSLDGRAGNDTLNGGAGHDSLYGGEGVDQFIGGDGNDSLNGIYAEFFGEGETVAETLDGGMGDDHYWVDHAGDLISDSGGIDTVHAFEMDWTLGAGFENLFLLNDWSESGKVGIGNELDNRIEVSYAGSRLEGRGGNDTLIGAGGDGTRNHLLGGDGDDSLQGADSGDTLEGGNGNDTLAGGFFPMLAGGAGADSFLFDEPVEARITDFASGSDRIHLDARTLSQLGASGPLAADDPRFYAAAGATGGHDADDRLVYDTSTGDLYYDADGNGDIGASRIATLTAGGAPAALSATDITVDHGGTSQSGTSGNDSLVGGSGNDLLAGLAGNDTLIGLGGHDTLDGGSGTDRMEGGDGDDTYHATSGDVTVELMGFGGGMFDTVIADTSWTLAQNVEILRLVEGASAAIRGTGNAGSNGIYGNSLANVLEGGSSSGSAGDTVYGAGGNDTITGFGYGTYSGEAGDDFINVEEGSADGGDGNDRIEGRATSARGGFGNDTIVSGLGHDSLYGGPGADTFIVAQDPHIADNWDQYILFESGLDELRFDGQVFTGLGPSGDFAAGDERFYAAAGAQSAHDATDRLIYNTSTGHLWYDPDGIGGAAAVLTGIVRDVVHPPANLQATDIAVDNGSGGGDGLVINGTAGNDTLTGTAGNDTINGLGGNDLINASAGSDVVDGGAGSDSIEYKAAATSAVVVNFNAGTISGGFPGGSVSFTGIERVVGGNFNDSLSGSAGSQNLAGQGGADTLTGGAGNDTLWGGTGNDAFVFNGMGTANADRISDFASGQDKVQLEDGAFTAIGATGNFAAGDARFWASSSGLAHDANDRVIYNTSTGQLYYDADGNGGGAAQLFATLSGAPGIVATDIAVV